MEAEKVSQSVLDPLRDRLRLGRCSVDVTFWQILLRADAEVRVDGAAAHGAGLQLGEAGRADASVTTWE